MMHPDTDLPWSWRSSVDPEYPPNYDLDCIRGKDGSHILTIYGNQKNNPLKDRAFIIHAVNSHHSLRAALMLVLDDPNSEIDESVKDIAEAILKQTEGTTP